MEQTAIETQKNEEQERLLRQQKRFERKLSDALEPDSIFIIPVGGRMGIELVINLTGLDRELNKLKRQVAFRIKYEDAVEVFKELDDTVHKLWESIKSNVPSLHSFKPEKWREVNDSKEKKLLLANRKISMCLVPRDEKIGQLAAGIKVLNEKIFELQSISSYEEVKKLAAIHNEVNTAMLDINKKIQKLINGPQAPGEKGPQTSGEKATQAPEEEKGPQVSREKNLPFPNAKK
ncbi:MAG: hypothetical protein NTX75_01710 [Proteobacteria bacterium]|nr:hypothetical protein [Pseudomonadota bacterium]